MRNTHTKKEPTLEAFGSFRALTNGLDVLKVLVAGRGPMTASQIAQHVELHQSTVSRILKTLMIAGYVRKPDYHSFALDYGTLALSGRAIHSFKLVERPREPVVELSKRVAGLTVVLATIWRGEYIHLLSSHIDQDLVIAAVQHFPLHLSSVALRLLVDMPANEALAVLANSRMRYGWPQPTALVPLDETGCLKLARQLIRNEVIVLDNYQDPGKVNFAIPIDCPGEPRACLALFGNRTLYKKEAMIELLTEYRAKIELCVGSSTK